MQVQIIGITKEMKSKKEDKNSKFFVVVVGYERPDMHGLQTRNIFLTNEMIEKAKGYVPTVGDICEAKVIFGGFVECLLPVQ